MSYWESSINKLSHTLFDPLPRIGNSTQKGRIAPVRKLMLAITLIAALFTCYSLSPVATAATNEKVARSSNMVVGMHYNNETRKPVFESWRHDSTTPDDDRLFTRCAPEECGRLAISVRARTGSAVIVGRRIVVKNLTDEQFVRGFFHYTTADRAHDKAGRWDGKPLPLTYRIEGPDGKMIKYKLVSAYAYLYNPAWGSY